MPIARHPAESLDGGRFKTAPAPDWAPIVDRIRSLDVRVRWERVPDGWLQLVEVVHPKTGPLAGREADAWLRTTALGVEAVVHVTQPPRHDPHAGIVIAPATGRWSTGEEAAEAVTGLMHGRAPELRWAGGGKDWRPMDQLAGWLDEALTPWSWS